MYTLSMVLELNPRLEKLVRESVQKGTFPNESALVEVASGVAVDRVHEFREGVKDEKERGIVEGDSEGREFSDNEFLSKLLQAR